MKRLLLAAGMSLMFGATTASAGTVHILMENVPDTRYIQDLLPEFKAKTGIDVDIEAISYIDMPEQIRGSYQYFTQSDVDRLLRAGYNGGFTVLEAAVDRYVKGYLDRTDRFR